MEKFVGLRLYLGPDEVRHLDAILEEGVVRLVLEGDDAARPLGWYSMDWAAVADPTVTA
jgi:hypothetical protein